MPERTKAVNRVVEALWGETRIRRNIMGEVSGVLLDDEGWITGEEFVDRFLDPVERLWEVAVTRIDFNQVLLNAQSRHIALDHEDEEDILGLSIKGVCGECVCEALLIGNTMSDWENVPRVPRGGYGNIRDAGNDGLESDDD